MALKEFAHRELTEAGLFNHDSMYDGMIGTAVLELIEKFAEQGHSGASASITLALFSELARFKPLSPLKNPTLTGEYVAHGDDCWQATRVNSVFSADKGKTWYDIDKRVPAWKRFFGIKRAYVKFATAGAK